MYYDAEPVCSKKVVRTRSLAFTPSLPRSSFSLLLVMSARPSAPAAASPCAPLLLRLRAPAPSPAPSSARPACRLTSRAASPCAPSSAPWSSRGLASCSSPVKLSPRPVKLTPTRVTLLLQVSPRRVRQPGLGDARRRGRVIFLLEHELPDRGRRRGPWLCQAGELQVETFVNSYGHRQNAGASHPPSLS
jgi:hypothetical protein